MPRVSLDKKLYLTVKEGSEYSGLPQSYLAQTQQLHRQVQTRKKVL